MSVVLNIEPFDAVLGEIQPLWQRHWEEVGMHRDTVPLDPDLDMYRTMDRMGALSITTARENGELIGYQFFIVRRNLHYKQTVHANSDLTYMAPKYRNGFTFMRMIRFAIEACKELGAQRIIMNTKVSKNYGRLLAHMGFEEMDHIYIARV